MKKVIKWAYRHGSLTSAEFDTLDEAVASASWASDAGEEALKSFEVFGDEHSLIDEKEAYDLMHAYGDRQYDEWMERTKDAPKATHRIDVKGTDGAWSYWCDTYSAEEALAKAADLKAMFGDERVSVRPVGAQRRY